VATQPAARVLHTVVGSWRSELGSELELHNTDGFLTGRYASAVGTVHDPQPLIGFCTPPSGRGTVVVGFVVRWPATGSLTTWTGRYDSDTDRMNMTWVLESATPSPTAWRATHLGQDEYRRSGPA
jgi:hypothetical protein